MAHMVKCSICGQIFNRDLVQAVRSGARRYAHQSCLPPGELVPLVEKKIKQKQEEDPDLKQLKDYINKLYGDKANWSLITRQIKEFKTKYNYNDAGNTFLWSVLAPYLVGILAIFVVFMIASAKNIDISQISESTGFIIVSAILTHLAFISVFFVYKKMTANTYLFRDIV